MRFKRLLALLVSAALALAVLVGCGSGQQSAAQALLKLLDGKYPNISIEIDPDLEADLRQAISQAEAENAGDDAAAIRAALEKLVGSTVTFRNLGDGQQGDTTFDLVFYAGTDIDKASQAAYSQWNIVFANVPDDGKYGTGLAMVETENGIWMLVKATVEKAGTVDKPDKDDDPEPEPSTITGEGFTYNKTTKEATISEKNGLEKLLEKLTPSAGSSLSETLGQMDITLKSSVDLPASWPENITFTGELNGNGNTITMTGTREQGLFDTIASGAIVKDVTISDSNVALLNPQVGLLAGSNEGTIQGCSIQNGRFSSSNSTSIQGNTALGFLVGQNMGKITDCTVTGSTFELTLPTTSGIYKTSTEIDGTFHFGGLAGDNYGTIRDSIVSGCTFNIENRCTLSIKARLEPGILLIGIGGAVGYNHNDTLENVTSRLPSSNILGGITMPLVLLDGVVQNYSWSESSFYPITYKGTPDSIFCIINSFGNVAGYDVQKENYI